MQRKDNENFADGLERHVLEEEASLERYRHLGGMLRDGPAGLLIRSIFLDEEHHHHVLAQMAKELRALSEEKFTIDAATRAEVRAMIEELIVHEEATIEKCRALKEQYARLDNDLFAALLEALVCDSEKHKRLLIALEEVIAA
jgi:hypothetical protein